MSKPLPTTISILGVEFTVEWNVPLSGGDWGETEVLYRRIKIGEVCDSPDKRVHTFLHEIIHCVLGLTGHAERFSGESDEEALVVALENGLAPLLAAIAAVGPVPVLKSRK